MAGNTKSYIVDASFILSYLLPDEKTDKSTRLLFEEFKNLNVTLYAPHLLALEIGNSLKMATIRKRISSQKARKLIDVFLRYQIHLVSVVLQDVFSIALKYNLTVYDASYVYLANIYKSPLLSTDKRLQQLAKNE